MLTTFIGVVGSQYSCRDVYTNNDVPESACMFASTYDYQSSKTFNIISNQNFNVSYEDHEYLTGIMGMEHLTLAGINVKQEVGVVNKAAWFGDGFTSGLVGLAFPALTSAFNGSDPDKDQVGSQVSYSPIITTMVKDKLIAPLFSMTLSRNTSINAGGTLAIGGLPSSIQYDAMSMARVLLQKTCNSYFGCKDTPRYESYTIEVDGIQFSSGDSTSDTTNNTTPFLQSSPFQATVDSGTSDLELPTIVANAFNALVDPPAVYNDSVVGYVTSCNASMPDLSIHIGGKAFKIDKRDLLLPGFGGLPVGKWLVIDVPGQLSKTNINNSLSGVNDGGENYVLGDVFMRNVLSVFDVGLKEMRFYSTFL